jgi:hypothetical protein
MKTIQGKNHVDCRISTETIEQRRTLFLNHRKQTLQAIRMQRHHCLQKFQDKRARFPIWNRLHPLDEPIDLLSALAELSLVFSGAIASVG